MKLPLPHSSLQATSLFSNLDPLKRTQPSSRACPA